MNRYWPLLLLLASVWGASYLFIKVAVEGGLEPAPLMCARAAIAALGALGSGVAYLLYFALIARAGASRAILVTYLVPAFALAYGAVILDEPLTASALGGLALVLLGTALATGALRRRR